MPSYFISTAIIGAGAAAKHKAISCKYFTIISGEVNNCTQYGSQHTSQWHSVTGSLSTPVVVTLKMELGFLLMFSPGVENDTFFLQIDILLEVRQNVGKYWNELQYYKSWRGDRARARNILILFLMYWTIIDYHLKMHSSHTIRCTIPVILILINFRFGEFLLWCISSHIRERFV